MVGRKIDCLKNDPETVRFENEDFGVSFLCLLENKLGEGIGTSFGSLRYLFELQVMKTAMCKKLTRH
jgi:hypothetical protein